MMTVAAVVLAAGAGRRLGGRNKALLVRADGRTFLDAVVAGARAVASRVVVVVAEPHGAAVCAAVDAELVWNPTPERGMVSSIACGLAALGDADAALVWPVDTPEVAPATVAAVVAAGAREAIVIPTYRGRGGHPTLFGAELWPALATAGSAREVIAAAPQRVVRLPVDDPGVRRDVDVAWDLR
jgi:molybdenum cofactor cytidylyltransferase